MNFNKQEPTSFISLGKRCFFCCLGIVLCQQQAFGADPNEENIETVIVTGYAKELDDAMRTKHSADVVSDSIASDAIGSLPDFGLGEALVRVPGVSTIINNGRGEAQLFTLRGLNADYNAVQVDGFSLPATETSRRNVSLDVIPSSLAQRVDIEKTVNANETANAIGGIANLVTRSAFDHDGLFVAGRADWAYYDNQRKMKSSTPSGLLEAVVSQRFSSNNHWGFVADLSYYRRDSSSLDSAVDTYSYVNPTSGATISDKNDPAVATAYAVPDRQRWLWYDNLRTRGGVFGKLEYQGSAIQAYLTMAWFQHKNDETRESNILIKSGNATNITSNTGSVAKASAQVDLAHYVQYRTIQYVQSGMNWSIDERSRLSVAANYAVSTYRQDAALYTYKQSASKKLAYTYQYDTGGFPTFTLTDDSNYYNTSLYLQSEKTNNLDQNVERVVAAKIDYDYTPVVSLQVSTGVDGRFLYRKYDYTNKKYVPNTPADFTLADVVSDTKIYPYNGAGRYLMLIDEKKAAAVYAANADQFSLSSSSVSGSLASDYHANEMILAGYLMGRYSSEDFFTTIGLRYEETRIQSAAYTITSTYDWAATTRSYGRILPSINVAYDILPDLKARAAFSQTLGRANYTDISGATAVTTGSATETITSSNPDLKPRQSNNYDLSLEYYPAQHVIAAVALFHKNIKKEIITTTSTKTETIDGSDVVVKTTMPVNTSNASVDGMELNIVYSHFDFLPGIWSGLGFAANATLLDEHPNSVTMDDDTVRRLPKLVEAAKTTVNVSLLYDYKDFNAKLAFNHTSDILWNVATDSPVNDRYYKAKNIIDAQVGYDLNRHIKLTLQGKNLTNERPQRMFGLNQELLREELYNGSSYWLGVRFNY